MFIVYLQYNKEKNSGGSSVELEEPRISISRKPS